MGYRIVDLSFQSQTVDPELKAKLADSEDLSRAVLGPGGHVRRQITRISALLIASG